MSKEKIGIGEKLGAKLTTVDPKVESCKCEDCEERVYHLSTDTFRCKKCGGAVLAKKSSSR